MTTAATPPAIIAAAPDTALTADIVARVDGVAIPKSELDQALAQMLTRGNVPPDFLGDSVKVAGLRRQLLDRLIAQRLLVLDATARQIAVDTAGVNAEFRQLRDQFPSDSLYRAQLADAGLTEAGLKEEIRKGQMLNKLRDTVILPTVPPVSAADRDSALNAARATLAGQEEVRARHILILADEGASASDVAKAEAKTKALRAKAVRPRADFAALAKANSQDPGSAENGGDLGWFGRGAMVPEFEQAAFALKPGEISPVIRSPYGFHIIKLDDRRTKQLSTQDSLAAMGNLENRNRGLRFNSYLDSLRGAHQVRINPALGSAAPMMEN